MASIRTLTKPRIEDFRYCLSCKTRVTHKIKFEGQKKYYRCENCGYEYWVYIELFGPELYRRQDNENTH